MKNKKLLCDLIEKKKLHDKESNTNGEGEEDEIASENSSEEEGNEEAEESLKDRKQRNRKQRF